MKVMFMGTPDFAVPCLQAVCKYHEVTAVVTQPDRPKGRGQKLMPPPVKVFAIETGIDVLQPETLKDGVFQQSLDKYKPDVIIVVAYGKILPEYILSYPKHGCINIHASLLPKYRGAAPIHRAIMDGEKESGVCTMKMEKGLDTGPVYQRAATPIPTGMTTGELHDRLQALGAELILSTLEQIDTLTPTPQSEEGVTYAAMISKSESKIDWNKSAEEIVNLISGMNPAPLASISYQGEIIKIIKAENADGKAQPGEILGYDKTNGLLVGCGLGILNILEIRPGGGKNMKIGDYLRGHELHGYFDSELSL